MSRLVRLRLIPRLARVLLLIAPTFALAAGPAPSAEAGADALTAATPRFTLESSRIESTPQQSGRYTLRARFAPEERAGELREGGNFSLIGRFAKGSVGCGPGGVIFSNGFEGN